MSKTDKEWREEKSFPLVPMNNGQVSKGMGEGVTNGLTDDQQGVRRPNKESHGGSEKRGDSNDIQCGVLSWRPACLRRFNNPQWLLFFFSLYAMALGKTGNASGIFCCCFVLRPPLTLSLLTLDLENVLALYMCTSYLSNFIPIFTCLF